MNNTNRTQTRVAGTVANRWHDAMELPVRFPDRHADSVERCHAAGQTKPTPLLPQFGAYRVNLRHGVSRVRQGQWHTLGVIFHDAA